LRVEGSGFWVLSSGFRVQGSKFKCSKFKGSKFKGSLIAEDLHCGQKTGRKTPGISINRTLNP
jgi:hypothetical protein